MKVHIDTDALVDAMRSGSPDAAMAVIAGYLLHRNTSAGIDKIAALLEHADEGDVWLAVADRLRARRHRSQGSDGAARCEEVGRGDR